MADENPSRAPTRRELETLQLMAQGLHSKRVADRMGVTVKTVEIHRQALYRKLGVRGQVAVTIEGLRRGLISLATEDECQVVHVLGDAHKAPLEPA